MAKKKKKEEKKGEAKTPEFGTIDLILKYEWYDKIESGEKKVEYRELKPHNCRRIKGLGLVCPYAMPSPVKGEKICQRTGKACDSGTKITQSSVNLRRGYTATSMRFALESLSVQPGDTAMGAPEGVSVINLGLGERVIEEK